MISKDVDPAPDHDAGAHGQRRAGRLVQDLLDLQSRGQVGREVLVCDVGHEAGEVDHAMHAGLVDGLAHRVGGDAVAVGEVGAVEAVHEVADGVDALDGRAHLGRLGGLHDPPLHPVLPGEGARPRG